MGFGTVESDLIQVLIRSCPILMMELSLTLRTNGLRRFVVPLIMIRELRDIAPGPLPKPTTTHQELVRIGYPQDRVLRVHSELLLDCQMTLEQGRRFMVIHPNRTCLLAARQVLLTRTIALSPGKLIVPPLSLRHQCHHRHHRKICRLLDPTGFLLSETPANLVSRRSKRLENSSLLPMDTALGNTPTHQIVAPPTPICEILE